MSVNCGRLHLSISNGFVSSKIYDKRDDFDFEIVNLNRVIGIISLKRLFPRSIADTMN